MTSCTSDLKNCIPKVCFQCMSAFSFNDLHDLSNFLLISFNIVITYTVYDFNGIAIRVYGVMEYFFKMLLKSDKFCERSSAG